MKGKRNKVFLMWSSVDPLYSTAATYSNPVVSKIKSFSNLANGWHFGAGIAIPKANIKAALDLVVFLERNSIINLDAFPGTNGEVQVTAYPENGSFLEVTIPNPGSVELILEDSDGNELLTEDSISMNEGKDLISSHKHLLFFTQNSAPSWSMRVSSAYITMTETSKGLAVWHSDHPQMEESQSSNVLVL
jgi:hypothetical protein